MTKQVMARAHTPGTRRWKTTVGRAWFDETLHDGVHQRLLISRELFRGTGDLQHIRVVDTPTYGRALILDGIVQTTERDEFMYHEMMTHVPMCAHPNPGRVLIIGGGDGGILREVLRHPVERVVLVEIDRRVVDLCREYLPTVSAGAFDDPRVELVIDDGAAYVRRATTEFDIAIIDSSDPVGPNAVLFTEQFYAGVARRLRTPGIMVRQSGSAFLQPEEAATCQRLVKRVCGWSGVYAISVPTYVGGLFTITAGGKGMALTPVDVDGIRARYEARGLKTRYYSPEVHQASLAVPPYVSASRNGDGDRQRKSKTAYGLELILDLYECEPAVLTSAPKLRQYVDGLCRLLKMRKYGPCQVPYFGLKSPKTKGYSIHQFIETSSIIGHISEERRAVYLNIFSCRHFDAEAATAFSRQAFGAKRVTSRTLVRQ